MCGGGEDLPTCDRCGGEIEFRYVGGSVRPLHIGGTSCGSAISDTPHTARSRFDKVESYLDPNARCPVCGVAVFFYRSPFNGRVFFDDVGWPWPKHGCTDRYSGPDESIPSASGSFKFHFKGRDGNLRDVYVLESIFVEESHFALVLKNVNLKTRIKLAIAFSELEKRGCTREDIEEATSNVIFRDANCFSVI